MKNFKKIIVLNGLFMLSSSLFASPVVDRLNSELSNNTTFHRVTNDENCPQAVTLIKSSQKAPDHLKNGDLWLELHTDQPQLISLPFLIRPGLKRNANHFLEFLLIPAGFVNAYAAVTQYETGDIIMSTQRAYEYSIMNSMILFHRTTYDSNLNQFTFELAFDRDFALIPWARELRCVYSK